MVDRIEVRDLGNGSVSLVFGDDRSGLRIIGDTDAVAALVAEAHRLCRIAQSR
jgi:hypothetical protein